MAKKQDPKPGGLHTHERMRSAHWRRAVYVEAHSFVYYCRKRDCRNSRSGK